MSQVNERFTPDVLHDISEGPLPDLVDGRLIARPPKGQALDVLTTKIAGLVGNWSWNAVPGIVNGARCGFQIFPGRPDDVRAADVAFTRRDRLPGGRIEGGHARVVPDLVVLVVARGDLATVIAGKIDDFLGAGVRSIWVVYPSIRVVMLWRSDRTGRWLEASDTLEGEDVLPGFRCEVANLFEDL